MTPVEELVAALTKGLAGIDAAARECPVNSTQKRIDQCPLCGATHRQNCGRNVSAMAGLETLARESISRFNAERADGVWVPREPTEAMIKAGFDALHAHGEIGEGGSGPFLVFGSAVLPANAVYLAMITASQTPAINPETK